jgi:hypothetical protein
MANSFKNSLVQAVGTSSVNVYAAGIGVQSTVIGFTISNVTASDITANVTVHSGGNMSYMVKQATIEPGSSMVPVGQLQKLVLRDGDYLRVQTNTPSSADVILSVLEIS